MLEVVDGDSVQKAGAKILALAEREHWSSALLYCVFRELVRFLEGEGVQDINAEDICNN